MHMQQPLRPRALVQIVDILGHDQQVSRPFGIEPRQRDMRGIGLDLLQSRPPRVVKLMHQHGIAHISLGRCDILDPVPLPQPIRRAKRLQSALGADASTSQHDDVSNLAHGRSLRSNANDRYGCLVSHVFETAA